MKRIPEMTGEAISYSAVQRPDSYGKPIIGLHFTSAGGQKRFAEVTRNIAASRVTSTGHLGEMAVVPRRHPLFQVASVNWPRSTAATAVIEGYFTEREAFNLANVLNNPLDLPLIVKSQFEVGHVPCRGRDHKRPAGVDHQPRPRRGLHGHVLHHAGGLVAVGTLAVNLVIILGCHGEASAPR